MKKVLLAVMTAAIVLSGCAAAEENKETKSNQVETKSTNGENNKKASTGETKKEEVPKVTQETVTPKASEKSVPREYTSALKKAESYAKSMNMSKAAIYDQLTSEYGENFPKEAAQYAIDNIDFDWNENALKKAKSYADSMSMSDSAIYDQLISEHGEKFTKEEAKYAIDHLE